MQRDPSNEDQRCAETNIPFSSKEKKRKSHLLKNKDLVSQSKHLSSCSSQCPFIASGGQCVTQVLVFFCLFAKKTTKRRTMICIFGAIDKKNPTWSLGNKTPVLSDS